MLPNTFVTKYGVPPAKPALVLLAGPLFDFPIAASSWEPIVAADGGVRHALAQDVLPDYVVGDFDSMRSEDRERLGAAGVPTTRLPTAKDLSDGEAAVEWLLERWTDGSGSGSGTGVDVVLAGGLGGRFDHSLASLVLLERLAAAGRRGVVTDGRQQLYLLQDGLVVPGRPGDLLSVMPLTPTVSGLSVTGVRWPLHGAEVRADSTLTLSNELQSAAAHFSVVAGRAAVVRVPREHA